MSEELTIKTEALEPLFAAWEEPHKHRVRKEKGQGSEARNGRRPSPVLIAQNLRAAVKEWRDNFYFGASETTRTLLTHWFGRSHIIGTNGGSFEFRYYFCQREAIETLIYLKEIRGLDRLSQLVSEFGGQYAEESALGITEDEDAWSRYAFKMATGSGKTKVMSLAVVWSYFHALRESESPMARHFVIIAPNLTVFERLKEDLKPEGGGQDIFDRDPLIPTEWRGDWNMSVVLQDEAGGASTGGVLYLTNIHRLFDKEKRQNANGDTYDWMGPAVSKAKALDTGAELRDRITAHSRLVVLNDEAHHVWDPDSAWSEAIQFLHSACRKRGGEGLVAQLDYSATPKDNKGNYFKHIICDTPLGEAVDGGIVKTPIIGRVGKLIEQATDNAAYRYEVHLMLGYKRWLMSKQEWEKSGKKPLLFIMCNDTAAADQITSRLNGDEVFRELNGRTLNLHTKLKGKIKSVGSGTNKQQVFIEDEKGISDDDLKELRRLSRELDAGSSPYYCIVSVLMLREGWDVRNVTTIVPLRPYTSKANILPEQTLGRGLRRMTPSGQSNEIVAVVEHEAFARLYREELSQEGLPIEIVDIEKVPTTTVSIFPDPRKDWTKLDIAIPRLTAATHTVAVLGPISEKEVREVFNHYKPLPVGEIGPSEVPYEGRHLITGEVVEHMKVNLALLESGIGAISFYVHELEYICKVKGSHQVLAPLLQVFFEQVLFGPGQSVFEPCLVARLSDSDVREHVRAVFVPLIRTKTVRQQTRTNEAPPVPVSSWRPFQVTVSERRPVLKSEKTVFNLVSCNRSFEQALVGFLDKAADVHAFAKNAGPQSLRIDYLADGQRLAFYMPDFILRTAAGSYLVETKGRVDRDVPLKAKAAVGWSKSASNKSQKWEYVFIPEETFQRFRGNTFAELARMCSPALTDLLASEKTEESMPLFAGISAIDTTIEQTRAAEIFAPSRLAELPVRFQKAIEEAISLFMFFEKKQGVSYAPVFTALLGVLDEAAKGLIKQKLNAHLPQNAPEQKDWFEPYLAKVDQRLHRHYQEVGRNLRKTLLYKAGVSPLGLLRNCLDYALNDKNTITGVFIAIKDEFRVSGARNLLTLVETVNDFRNTRIAHQEKTLYDGAEAKGALKDWCETLSALWDEQAYAAYRSICSVQVNRLASENDSPSDFIAEIKIFLQQIDPASIKDLSKTDKKAIFKTVESEIQPLVDFRFGAKNVLAKCTAIRPGSLEIVIILASTYKFVKDYDKLRTNMPLLSEDIKRACGKLKKSIDALFEANKNTFI